MNPSYPTLKCIHVLAIISWMAGLLYYFRLFVYHFEFGQKNSSIHTLLSLMEKRLYRYITLPAGVVATLTGAGMIFINPSLLSETWFQLKAATALSMIAVTLYGLTPLQHFKEKKFAPYTSRGLRILNEVPTLLMILIVILVIIRPFR